jgi:hypothetical protein
MMCKYCARVNNQLRYVRNALRAEDIPQTDPAAPLTLYSDGRNRLKQVFRNAVKYSG